MTRRNLGSGGIRVLHAALVLRLTPGIANQMQLEQEAAKALGLPWSVRMFMQQAAPDLADLVQLSRRTGGGANRNFLERVADYITWRLEYYQWLLSEAKHYDVLILRHSTSDPFQWIFMLVCKKPVYVVHHTLEIAELRAIGGASSLARILLESVFGTASNLLSAGVIGVTQEIVRQRLGRRLQKRKRLYVYPNGISADFSSDASPQKSVEAQSVPQIAFVASIFSPWHGLDRLLNDIERVTAEFTLHLVGTLTHVDESRARKDPRLVLHGRLANSELSDLLANCDLGLSSFGLDRLRMSEACPLKVREYLALGLAVYSGHKDVFPPAFPFFRSGPPSITSILRFHREVAGSCRLKVSKAAAPYVDKADLLLKLYHWLSQARASATEGNYIPGECL